MNRTERIVKEEIIAIKPVSRMVIGDVWYLEQIRSKTATGKILKNLKDLTVNTSIRCCNVGFMKITEKKIKYGENSPMEFGGLNVYIAMADNEEILNTYKNGEYYPSMLKESKNLGCDTASFSIIAGRGSKFKGVKINTLADGYYGSFMKMKEYYGMIFDFDVTADAYTFDELKRDLLSVFEAA